MKRLQGHQLSLSYLQEHGFNNPLLVLDRHDLDLKVPPAKGFGVADVRHLVGSRRLVDVIDCDTQKSTSMTMKDWQRCVRVQSCVISVK